MITIVRSIVNNMGGGDDLYDYLMSTVVFALIMIKL